MKTQTLQPEAPVQVKDAPADVRSLNSILPGIPVRKGDPVSLPIPPFSVTQHRRDYDAFLTDPGFVVKRRALLNAIKAVLELNANAKSQGATLQDAAREASRVHRQTLETAWVSLLEQNHAKEVTTRWAATFFSNLQDSWRVFRGKIFAVDASAAEIASDAGREVLRGELSNYVSRPDPRLSRAFVVVQGWAGSAAALDRLGRVIHDHRALLISDAPEYDTMEQLRAASAEGGLLESLPGDKVHHRHMILLANQGRARRRFRGRFAEEKEDLHIPLSGPWFGTYLDNIARGKPWRPPVGYQNPLVGVDGVLLDLKLEQTDGFGLYMKHRLNPAIRLSHGSETIVIWGPDALSKTGTGVQMGVAVVEMIMVRYAEWIVNQYGLLNDLHEAEDVVGRKLSGFVNQNSGADRMFLAGSRVVVKANEERRELEIEFHLNFRELAERAVIRVCKPVSRDKLGEVGAESHRS